MRLLALTMTLLFPALLHAGSLTTLASVTCDESTFSVPVGDVECFGAQPGGASAEARVNFAGLAGPIWILAEASAWVGDIRYSATASVTASYQITFFGADGPGYITASFCDHNDHYIGRVSGSLVTPNGNIQSLPAPNQGESCNPPGSYIPIVFGQPLNVALSMDAEMNYHGNAAEAAYIGFSGYSVFDANMKPVTWTAAVVIPEPPAWQLGITGLALLLASSRFIRRSSTSAAAAPRTSPS